MVTSLGLIIVLGLLVNFLFEKIKLPGLLGMLLLGVALGPYGFGILDKVLLDVSQEFRTMALIIILLRAGLGISREKLNQVGGAAIKFSFIPGIIEGFTIAFASTQIFGLSFVEGGILGFVIAAVSPAVVVPLMLKYMDEGVGTNKNIPTLLLAGASIDDVFAITMFSTFLGLYSGSKVNIGVQILSIPIAIVLGILVGAVAGLIMVVLFKKYHIRDTKKVLLILGTAILLTTLEGAIKSKIEIAGLLGVMTIGFIILEKLPHVAKRLSVKFNKIWLFAEILLFVLVGAQVNVNVAFDSGLLGLLLIAIGLLGRSFGVILSVLGTNLNIKERLFTVVAYTPKATVQAAIGAIPLSLGVESGDLILAIAVLSIIVTAPLGAIGIRYGAEKWLVKE